jgi:glycerol-3-phosphate dehydrogenase
LIVGGGVTGAYTALDASLRGYRVALVEKNDFASGTSSKSSKMVHGGLRYIEQGNLGLVRHSLLERQRLRRNARHLVQRLPFMFPVLDKNGIFDKRMASAFESLLWTYDLAGGWREGILHQKLTPAEVLSHCPTLNEEQLSGGFMYFDARVDDARLTLALVRTAAFHGAAVVNHAQAIDTTRDGHGKVNGARVRADDREIAVKARVVIMATGVWLRDWNGQKKAPRRRYKSARQKASMSRFRGSKFAMTARSPSPSPGANAARRLPAGAMSPIWAPPMKIITVIWTMCAAPGKSWIFCWMEPIPRSKPSSPRRMWSAVLPAAAR